jgi:sigma-B regulation protein RsbU (phosphoserine phosphatase)
MYAMSAVRGVSYAPDIHAVSRPARTFTGDFYFTHRHEDRLWLALGDVAGKGLPAAIVMAMIQEELEQRIISCANADCDPSRTMQRLHEFLLPLLPQNRFATAVIGWLDPDGTLTIANAGHCPPLVVRADGHIEQIGSTGPIAGVLPGSQWRSVTTRLRDGDALVLYSDGVTEASVDGEELGVWGLRELVARAPRDGRASDIANAVLAQIPGSHDDLTMLVVRPAPSS